MNAFMIVAVLVAARGDATDNSASGDSEAQQTADFVLAGMKDSRDRLRSGVFHARGHLDESARPEYPLEGEIEVFCAFDFDKGFLRFDRLEPMWWAPEKSSAAGGDGGAAKLLQDGGKFIQLPDRRIQWRVRDRRARILAPQKKPSSMTRPFDIRVIGLTNWAGLDSNISWEDILRFLQSPVHQGTAETDTIYRVVRVDQEYEYRLDVLFDADKGFSPVRLELREGPSKSTGEWAEPSEVNEVTWAQKEGVWVPTSFYQQVKRPIPKRREFTLDWESVNQPLDESLLTWKGLGLPKGTFVTDERLGKPIKVAVVGIGEFAGAGDPRGTFRWLIAAVTVVVIVLLVGFLALRNRFRRSS